MEIQEITFENMDFAREVFGPGNAHLDTVASITGVRIESRGNELSVYGEDPIMVGLVCRYFAQIYDLVRGGHQLFDRDIEQSLRIMLRDPSTPLKHYYQEALFAVSSRKTICPKTVTQREYLHALREVDLTVGIGPAGTGKTYLALQEDAFGSDISIDTLNLDRVLEEGSPTLSIPATPEAVDEFVHKKKS